ncbi:MULTISPECIES: type II toxin-antitoxin system VapC family toxin [unclassified Nostoc]|uniref:type II toxin-antitoxin system VapC family toxin n=1 Tax=unclassified Nostoc TaxID=2593658 RepID=UPI002AD52AB6|nr:type II toxin-antitoxin system VapC family toxin [Nostoc sp. DedQUE03]MDZ7972256.1 type II toxin-antitoxin system VapC family toxin [Nostoc sp. DedQUE03]MDZ8044602.1 type II toxin-antitoxin system VapC family toxin [Nostoc sp. DedQUE02]
MNEVEKSLLDTDILSEIIKRVNPRIIFKANNYLHQFDKYTISAITVMEIVEGWQKRKQEKRLQQFLTILNSQEILSFDLTEAVLAGKIYADLETTGKRIGYPDCMIAAIAISHNLTLVTGNFSHYQRIQDLNYSLKLDNWRL